MAPEQERDVRRTAGAVVAYVLRLFHTTEVASGELRNDTSGLVRRVAAGEDIVITVGGRPVARLRPLNQRPRWIAGSGLASRLARRQADPGLLAELRGLAPETTDDLPL